MIDKLLNLSLNKNKVWFSLLYFISVLFISIILSIWVNFFSVFFTLLIFLVIYIFFYFKNKIYLFDPIILFLLYSLLVVPVSFYLIFNGFSNSNYFSSTYFREDQILLFNKVLFLFLISFVFIILGYLLNKNSAQIEPIRFEKFSFITDKALVIVIASFTLIGIINFIYNIHTYSDDNIFQYFKQISERNKQFKNTGTNIGYNFLFYAVFCYTFYSMRKGKYSIFYFFLVIFSIFVKFSDGRIIQTLTYILTFAGIYYYFQYSNSKFINNSKFIRIILFVFLLGIFIYFIRLLSSVYISISYKSSVSFFSILEIYFTKIFSFNDIFYYLINKGNLPNIPVTMKIIDSWQVDYGLMYGKSFLSPLTHLIPGALPPEKFNIEIIIKNMWYSHVEGGNLPPTGVGEIFANFGYVGLPLVMYLFGAFMALLYNLLIKYPTFWMHLLILRISLTFVMIYSKGDSSNLNVFEILFLLFTYFLLVFFSKLFSKI